MPVIKNCMGLIETQWSTQFELDQQLSVDGLGKLRKRAHGGHGFTAFQVGDDRLRSAHFHG